MCCEGAAGLESGVTGESAQAISPVDSTELRVCPDGDFSHTLLSPLGVCGRTRSGQGTTLLSCARRSPPPAIVVTIDQSSNARSRAM